MTKAEEKLRDECRWRYSREKTWRKDIPKIAVAEACAELLEEMSQKKASECDLCETLYGKLLFRTSQYALEMAAARIREIVG